MPPTTTIGVLVNPGNAPQTAAERRIVQDVGGALGADFLVLSASSPDEIKAAFASLVSERVGALVVSGENFFVTQCNRLVDLAAEHAVPTAYAYSVFPVAGGLMSYGTDYTDLPVCRGNTSAGFSRGRGLLIFQFNRSLRSIWSSI
jgi:putative tryptophan/tyrosine transport system substrate-binding protein